MARKTYLPVTGSWYILTGGDCPNQTRYNNFEVREGRSPGYFVLVCGFEVLCLLVCPVWHTSMHQQMASKNKLAEQLCQKEVIIPTYFVFVEKRAPAAWSMWLARLSKCTLRTYLFLSSSDLKDEVAFLYKDCFAVVRKPATYLTKKGGTGCGWNQRDQRGPQLRQRKEQK